MDPENLDDSAIGLYRSLFGVNREYLENILNSSNLVLDADMHRQQGTHFTLGWA